MNKIFSTSWEMKYYSKHFTCRKERTKEIYSVTLHQNRYMDLSLLFCCAYFIPYGTVIGKMLLVHICFRCYKDKDVSGLCEQCNFIKMYTQLTVLLNLRLYITQKRYMKSFTYTFNVEYYNICLEYFYYVCKVKC